MARNISKQPPTRVRAPGTPTPERMAKEPDGFETTLMRPGTPYREPEVSHRVREPRELYKQHFLPQEFQALERLCRDYTVAMSGQQITGRYDGMPQSGGGPRHGGVPDRFRDAHNRIMYFRDALTPGEVLVLTPIVDGVHNLVLGRRLTIQDVALQRGAAYRDKADLAKVWVGLTKALAERIYEIYRAIDARDRQPKAPTDTRALPQQRRIGGK